MSRRRLSTWKRVPVLERVQPLYRLKFLLEQNLDDGAHHHQRMRAKTFAESRAEIQRGIENVESRAACLPR